MKTHDRIVHQNSKPDKLGNYLKCDMAAESLMSVDEQLATVKCEINVESLITTISDESKPSLCEICMDPLMLRSDFEAHQAKEHGMERYPCNLSFSGSESKRQHNLLVHHENHEAVLESGP